MNNFGVNNQLANVGQVFPPYFVPPILSPQGGSGTGDQKAQVAGSVILSANEELPSLKLANRTTVGRYWTDLEDNALKEAYVKNPADWKKIAESIPGRTPDSCKSRWGLIVQPNRVLGPWDKNDSARFVALVQAQLNASYSINWKEIATHFPGRTSEQCRSRWNNQLNPSINHEEWSPSEDQRLLSTRELHKKNSWSVVAGSLPGRTPGKCRSRWKYLTENTIDLHLNRSLEKPEDSKESGGVSSSNSNSNSNNSNNNNNPNLAGQKREIDNGVVYQVSADAVKRLKETLLPSAVPEDNEIDKFFNQDYWA